MTRVAGSRQQAVGSNSAAGAPATASCLQHHASHRSGLTLVELLVSITIIAILSALLLGVAGRAGETARQARTKQLVTRLHTLITERYESYRSRRVELRDDFAVNLTLPNAGYSYASGSSQARVAGRLAGQRELMKLEMPDRWSDVLLEEVQNPPIPVTANELSQTAYRTLFVRERPSLNALYLRQYNTLQANGVSKDDLETNQGAELLYLTVMNATADGEARSLFNQQDVGDTDEDGALEFLDGWGQPIGWLRWAPGYESDLQISFIALQKIHDRSRVPNGIDGVQTTLDEDHDPLDVFVLDATDRTALNTSDMSGARGWRLVPLIYSGGGDEELGLELGFDVENNYEYLARANPYANDVNTDTTGPQRLGDEIDNELAADDITNHWLSAR